MNRFYRPPVDPGYSQMGAGLGQGIMGLVNEISRGRQRQADETRQADADQKADFWDRAKRAELGMQGLTEGPIREAEMTQRPRLGSMPGVDELMYGAERQDPIRAGLMQDMPEIDFSMPDVSFRDLEHLALPGGMAYTPSRDMRRIAGEEQAAEKARMDEDRFQRTLQQALMLEEARQGRDVNWSSPFTSEGGDVFQVNPRTGEVRPLQTPEGSPLRGRQQTEPGWGFLQTDQGIYRGNARTGQTAPTGLQPRPTASSTRDPKVTALNSAARALRAEFAKSTWGGLANNMAEIGLGEQQRNYFERWKQRSSGEALRAMIRIHGLAQHGITEQDLMSEFERIYFGGDDGDEG